MAVTKKSVVEKMTAAGVYKEEFDETIARYVEMKREYSIIYGRYKKDGFACEVMTAAGSKKSPVVTTLEALRRDLLAMEDALGLTPRGLQKLKEKAFETGRKSPKGTLV